MLGEVRFSMFLLGGLLLFEGVDVLEITQITPNHGTICCQASAARFTKAPQE
jgi:hypothetical protein